jgi:hypothetical protein
MWRHGLIPASAVLAASALGVAAAFLTPVSAIEPLVGDALGTPGLWRLLLLCAVGGGVGVLVARGVRGREETARWVLFSLIVSLAIVFGFFSFRPRPFGAVEIVRTFGYWQILAVFGLFAACLAKSLKPDWNAAIARWRRGLLPGALVLAAAGMLHLHEAHEYKIVMDEVVLQSTATQMHFDRQVAVTVRGYDLAGVMTPLASYVDKRPLFFPFLVSVLHDLTGYRWENAFVLNGLLSVALMGLTYLAGRRLAGRGGGTVAVLLMASIPLVHQNATGSGFELLNLVMILSTLLLGMRYVEAPGTDRLGAFLFSGVLLAQTRYESALFVLPVGAVVLFEWWRKRRPELSWPVLIAPLLVAFIPLHFNVFKISSASWQLSDISGAESPFGLEFFYDNIGHSLNFLFATDGIQPNSMLVSGLGIVGVAFLTLVLLRDHRRVLAERPAESVFFIFVLGLLAHTALIHLYFWGHFDDPVIRRLSLPLHLLFILAFVAIAPQLIPSPRRWMALAAVTVVFMAGVTLPNVAMHRYNEENFAARWNNWIAGYLSSIRGGSALAIDRHSTIQWFMNGMSAITVDALAASPEKFEFHFRNRSFDNFYAVQILGSDFNAGTNFPTVDDDLGDGLILETVATVTMSPVYHMRLSRVTGVDVAKIREWRTRRQSAVQITPETKSDLDRANADALDRWFRMLP